MKKKLSLQDLKVSSFVTETEENEKLVGGMTRYSCYRYVSCFEFQCALRTQPDYCRITNHVTDILTR